MSTDKLAPFLDQRCINLETYRKSGQAVKTPVWFVLADRAIYVVTASTTGKVKRLRNDKDIRIVPCSFRGKPKGDWVEGEAYFADPAESERALKLRKKKYGLQAKLANIFASRKGELVVIGIKI
ncbi:MAG: PPOX class F420-dependent oxidoreductase [Thaumarchaeota archaeon]|nr:PPOX class F420-dependent oxidoreductase [Nitrososphaerota archaeon]